MRREDDEPDRTSWSVPSGELWPDGTNGCCPECSALLGSDADLPEIRAGDGARAAWHALARNLQSVRPVMVPFAVAVVLGALAAVVLL